MRGGAVALRPERVRRRGGGLPAPEPCLPLGGKLVFTRPRHARPGSSLPLAIALEGSNTARRGGLSSLRGAIWPCYPMWLAPCISAGSVGSNSVCTADSVKVPPAGEPTGEPQLKDLQIASFLAVSKTVIRRSADRGFESLPSAPLPRIEGSTRRAAGVGRGAQAAAAPRGSDCRGGGSLGHGGRRSGARPPEHRRQRRHTPRVELGSRTACELAERLVDGPRFAVGPSRDHRLEGICDRDDRGLQRDLGDAVRIAPPVRAARGAREPIAPPRDVRRLSRCERRARGASS